MQAKGRKIEFTGMDLLLAFVNLRIKTIKDVYSLATEAGIDKKHVADRNIEDVVSLQNRYREFLNKCVSGHFDVDFANLEANKVLSSHPSPTLEICKTSHEWSPRVRIHIYWFTIENALGLFILESVLHWGLEEFEKIRKCPQCGTFFIGKTRKAKFCSTKCRVISHLSSVRLTKSLTSGRGNWL